MSKQLEISELLATIAELENATKVLVRRDLELRRVRAELEEIDVRKSEFISIAAHQLRTPLSAINWSLQFLLDEEAGTLNEEQTAVVQQAQTSIGYMVKLVNDLLDAEHLEYDKVLFASEAVNIDKLITQVVKDLKPIAEKFRVTVHLNLDSHTTSCYCDATRIKDALSNVINNAIKYSFPSSIVTVSTKVLNSAVLISVHDTGIGIPEKYQSHIFQKFTRADNAQKIDPNGSGLGMFIAKKIVEAHGGTIVFTSEPNVETVFRIELPLI